MDEFFILLFGVCGTGFFLAPLIMVLIVWGKVGRLQREVDSLRVRVETGTRPVEQLAAKRKPAAADEILGAEDIEVISAPPPRRSTPTAGPPPKPTQPVQPPPAKPRPAEEVAKEEPGAGFSIEELLAGRWLGWVGAVAVVLGAGYFFKYAIDQDYIGETGRVVIGILVGAAVFAGGTFAMIRDYRWLGQGLAGAGAGILYFALTAAYQFYDGRVMSVEAAFAGMALVTIGVLAFSTIFNSQATAILGLIGGFLTPLMLTTGTDRQWELFIYLFLLDLGVLGIASFRKWQPLQITAFCFTLLMWLGWFARYYQPEKLTSTVILMTAFFLLFALLGVWHNALRKQPARPGDFFLMLATPIVYFVALYTITKSDYAAWHGLLAVALAGSYLLLAMLQISRNPEGKLVIVCLAGVAASFLTVAVPLQLTGHWIAIVWAAESLLLVELGLRFAQPKLRYVGFGLLFVVQLILMFYTGQTFDHPGSFQTRFTRASVDPVAADVMPSGVVHQVVSTLPRPEVEPSWTEIFNGRSLSFLASAIVLAILAWEYRRERWRGLFAKEGGEPSTAAITAGGWFTALVPLTVLGLLIVETFSLAYSFEWRDPTVLAWFVIWGALTAGVLTALAVSQGPPWIHRVGLGVFAIVGLLLLISMFATLGSWRGEWNRIIADGADPGIWQYMLVNPRSLSFLVAIGIAGLAAVLVRRAPDEAQDATFGIPLPSILGLFAYLIGLLLITTEMYSQGVIREWERWTALSITLAWLVYAIATIVAGIYYRSGTVRVLALSLFVLTTGKVFFYDVWQVDKIWRTVAFTALGAALLTVSFLYRRYKDRIRAWITTAPVILGAAGLLLCANNVYADDPPPRDPLETLAERWPITAPIDEASERGLVGVVVPPDLYQIAQPSLSDVRLLAVDEATMRQVEIPYVLMQPRDVDQVTERSVPLLNLSEIDGNTQFLLDLGDAAEPVRELVVEISSAERNYERAVSVFGSDQRDGGWALLTDDEFLLDRTRDDRELRVDRVHFPRSQFRFYRVLLHNEGRPPLRVTGAKVADRIEDPAPRHEFPAEILSREHSREDKESVILLDLKIDELPTSGLRFDIDYDGDYYRHVQMEITDSLDDEKTWRHSASFDVYRIERTGRRPARQNRIDYTETRGRYVRLTIDNGDDAPLRIDAVTAMSIDRLLVCERERLNQPGMTVGLYAGDKLLPAPRYDLARTVGTIESTSLPPTVLVAAREANPFFAGPTKPRVPWSEEHAMLLWTLTIGGVVILGGLTALMLYRAAGAARK